MYTRIYSFNNLFTAFQKAARGKKDKRSVANFSFHAEPFIYDSYANRKEKGTHKAINRYQQYARKYPFVLKCDIRKFFPSLDHEILKQEIRWRIHCPDTLWLVDTIIDRSNPQEEIIIYYPGDDLFTPTKRRRGLPIGNLTSQFWANVYMNGFDHFVKEVLRVPGYIRYVDDFVLFADSKKQLHVWRKDLENYLNDLRLSLHPRKTQIYRVENGIPFLEFSVFPYHRYVLKEKVKRYKRFLRKKIQYYRKGNLTAQDLETALNAWLGHIRFGQSQRLEVVGAHGRAHLHTEFYARGILISSRPKLNSL